MSPVYKLLGLHPLITFHSSSFHFFTELSDDTRQRCTSACPAACNVPSLCSLNSTLKLDDTPPKSIHSTSNAIQNNSNPWYLQTPAIIPKPIYSPPPPPIITHPTHSSSKAQTCPPASSPATPPPPAAADNTPPPHPARPDHTLPPVDSTPDSLPPHIPRDIAPAAAMYAPRNTPAAAAASDTPHPPPRVPRRTTRDPAPTTTARMTFLAP